jgi:hypothetical protein
MKRRTVVQSIAMGAAMLATSNRKVGAQPKREAMQQPSGPFVEASDGTQLFCRVWGSGKPVVFCHPWALNAEIWEYQALELSERGLQCIAYDRRVRGWRVTSVSRQGFSGFAGDESMGSGPVHAGLSKGVDRVYPRHFGG